MGAALGTDTDAAPGVRVDEARRPRSGGWRTEQHAQAPRLRPWSSIWRYLAAIAIALQLWSVAVSEHLPPDLDTVSTERLQTLLIVVGLDLGIGMLALALLPVRRRRPVLVAAVTASLSSLSAASGGAASLAAVSMSTRRRWSAIPSVGVLWIGGTLVYYQVPTLPRLLGEPVTSLEPAVAVVMSAGLYVIVVLTGFYVGARRELLASLQQRAETAEREQALRATAARAAERTRIAREMHDVLAHRISLVAMHANVLAYRSEMSADQNAQVAKIVQDNAHQALTELRQVLGVLRGGRDDAAAEARQPTLADLADLLAVVDEAGTQVTVEAAGLLDQAPPGAAPGPTAGSGETGLSETVSRAAYRIIQEALTNARKHAPGGAVALRLDRHEGWLRLEVRNGPVERPAARADRVPGAGVGLIGLAERAQLVRGRLEHGVQPDGGFAVRAWLPWP